ESHFIVPDTIPARAFRTRHQHRSEEHTSELQSLTNLVCRLLLEKKKKYQKKFSGHALNVYRSLRNINSIPYLFYFDYGDYRLFVFFFNDPATTEIYPLSLHPVVPI